MTWTDRAEFKIRHNDEVGGPAWRADAHIPGFRPREYHHFGTSPSGALVNLLQSIRANPPKRIDLPNVTEIIGILSD